MKKLFLVLILILVSAPTLEQKMTPTHKFTFNISVVAFAGMIGVSIFFPMTVNADMVTDSQFVNHKTVALMMEEMRNETKAFGSLPVSKEAKPRKTFTLPITAYTSEVAQTDDTPCITASGLDVCNRDVENVIAANFLPIGTHVRIPELYGNRVFTVQDRMNARYDKHVDVWLKDLGEAKQFGLKFSKIEVF